MPSHLKRTNSHYRLAIFILALSILVLSCALVSVRPTITPTAIVLPTETLTPTPIPPTQTPGPAMAGTPVPQPVASISPDNAGRLVELARWGKGHVEHIAYSSDGRLLAVASSIGVYLYDAQTLAQVRFIETPSGVWSAAFSPDGRMLASGSWDGTVRLWGIK